MTGAPDIIGVALRTGWFYGPATSRGPGGEHVEAIRRRRFPVLGSGGGMWPFVHVDDVAVATTLNAIERGQAGVYNVVDGDSAPVAQWLPDPRRDVAGADPPRHVPACIAPRAADAHGVAMMTATRRLERQAREAFGWSPA